METCLICGKDFNPMAEPFHEMDCEELFTQQAKIKEKTNPDLQKILENLLNEKK